MTVLCHVYYKLLIERSQNNMFKCVKCIWFAAADDELVRFSNNFKFGINFESFALL